MSGLKIAFGSDSGFLYLCQKEEPEYEKIWSFFAHDALAYGLW